MKMIRKKKHTGQGGAEKKYIRKTKRTNRGVKKGNLYMTNVSNHFPSVLVEGGFMTNKEEATLITVYHKHWIESS
ncbi:N-acetylmuramoyl-L-alanine amidase [Bacillus sp. IB182487]|uniref:N-acetylmuramoyl-L-alanine amidase n=2 Tax=Metabacillus arenae TaxID=2771434 RepID=A0A926NKP4_9BACI|nr:N-acetylmuramoyl-L-alanine amidase [Metabacillus arenae]